MSKVKMAIHELTLHMHDNYVIIGNFQKTKLLQKT